MGRPKGITCLSRTSLKVPHLHGSRGPRRFLDREAYGHRLEYLPGRDGGLRAAEDTLHEAVDQVALEHSGVRRGHLRGADLAFVPAVDDPVLETVHERG